MKRTFFLFVIIGIAFILRVYKVDTIPPSLSWDEVSIGYNAYSILKTGFDEHHRFLPLDAFIAYGDYKPPLAIYLTVPFIAIFGLTELAVRLPSAIAGTMTVLVVYLLVKELFKEAKNYSFGIWHLAFGMPEIASLLLAISPWHIQLSRAGFEANIALFFITCGSFLVLRARTKHSLLYVCWIPFVLAMYTFNSARYFSPILGIGLITFIWKEIVLYRKQFIAGLIIGFILLLPIFPHLVSKESRLRFQEVNIFTDLSVVTTANERIFYDGGSGWSKILHNRRFGYARSYILHFLENIEPWFLFIRGDGNPKFSLQDVGQLYVIEAPLLVLGIFWLFKNNKGVAWLLLYWIIAAIIPAATARETPHALRIENTLPVWQIFIAYAIVSYIKPQVSRKKFLIGITIVLLYFGCFSYFWHNYMNHYSTEYSGEWQWGYREAIRTIQPIKHLYDEVVMTENIGRPYIYVLFYEKVDPNIAWQGLRGIFDAEGFYNVSGFDTYRFVRESVELKPRTLYVLPPDAVPQNAHVISIVRRLNDEPVLVIFDI